LAADPAASVSLDDPDGVARLLRGLREAGAAEQVAALIARDPAASVSLGDPRHVASLLGALWEAGAGDQVAALVGRLPAEGQFLLFREQAPHQGQYRFGRQPDGTAALPWDWEKLG